MSTNKFTQSIVLFVVLTIAGVCLVVLPQDASDAQVRAVLPLLGAAMFSSALTFFLVRMTDRAK